MTGRGEEGRLGKVWRGSLSSGDISATPPAPGGQTSLASLSWNRVNKSFDCKTCQSLSAHRHAFAVLTNGRTTVSSLEVLQSNWTGCLWDTPDCSSSSGLTLISLLNSDPQPPQPSSHRLRLLPWGHPQASQFFTMR